MGRISKEFTMRFIPTRVHGLLDYLVGFLLIIAPWLFGFARSGAETWVPVVLGASAIVYSLLTDYEWGVSRIIPMRIHLMLDGIDGALLALSPWILGFSGQVWGPHLAIGLFEIFAALCTQTYPSFRPRRVGGMTSPRLSR